MRSSSRRETLLLFLLLFWILFVLGGYYYYHKPVKIEMIIPPALALLDLLFMALFAGLAGGLGRRLLRAERIPELERCAVQFALGAGVIGLVWFALGLLGLYRFPAAVLALLAGVIFLWREARGWFSDLAQIRQAWQCAGGFEKLLGLAVLVLALYQMLVALAPPIKWDALAYHLQLPRQYLEAGRFIFTPENPYWGHPQLVEMLYTFAMAFHRVETAALLGWSAGAIFLIGLVGFTNSQLARLQGGAPQVNAGWMAAAAVMAGATFRYLAGWSYTDLFSALFGLAALVVFFAWIEHERRSWLLWAGVFSGMAIATKWTAGLLFLGIFGAALIIRPPAAERRRQWLLGALAAFAVVLPWLLKNLLVTGSPIYPYFIGTPWYDAARLASTEEGPPRVIEWWLHIFAPFTTTWAGVDSAAGFSADLGPVLLLFAVPGFLVYGRDPRARTFLILLGLAAISIAAGGLYSEHLMQTRLYYAVLPAMAVPCGWGWEWVR